MDYKRLIVELCQLKTLRARRTPVRCRFEGDKKVAAQLGPWVEALTAILEAEDRLPRRERRSTIRLFGELRGRGYDGAHDSIHRFVKNWRAEHVRAPARAFIPLRFEPGEAYQFDSHGLPGVKSFD
jgi:hypothetical protein